MRKMLTRFHDVTLSGHRHKGEDLRKERRTGTLELWFETVFIKVVVHYGHGLSFRRRAKWP